MNTDIALNRDAHCEFASSNHELNVLYLDDDAVDHKLMSLILRRQGEFPRYKLSCVSEIDEARVALQSGDFDIFVLDNRMPLSPNFHTTLAQIGSIDHAIKIVVVSSETDSAEFRNFSNLRRKPDAIVEKSKLNKFIKAGNLKTL